MSACICLAWCWFCVTERGIKQIYTSCYFLLLHARYVNIISRSRKVLRINVKLNKVEFNFVHGQWNDRIIEFVTYHRQGNISTFPFPSESPQNNYSCLTVVGTASVLKPCRTPHTRHLSAAPPVSQYPSRWHNRVPEAAPSPFILRRSSEEGRICIQKFKTFNGYSKKKKKKFIFWPSLLKSEFFPRTNRRN